MAKVPEPHTLTAIDEAQRRATCTHCGPVKVFRSGGGWRCSVAHAEYKRLKRAEDKEKRETLRSETRCCGLPFDLPPLPAGQSHTAVVVRCICGQTRAIRRLHMRSDRSDRLTWIEAAEVYVDGVRQYVVSAEQFQDATRIDLRSI